MFEVTHMSITLFWLLAIIHNVLKYHILLHKYVRFSCVNWKCCVWSHLLTHEGPRFSAGPSLSSPSVALLPPGSHDFIIVDYFSYFLRLYFLLLSITRCRRVIYLNSWISKNIFTLLSHWTDDYYTYGTLIVGIIFPQNFEGIVPSPPDA